MYSVYCCTELLHSLSQLSDYTLCLVTNFHVGSTVKPNVWCRLLLWCCHGPSYNQILITDTHSNSINVSDKIVIAMPRTRLFRAGCYIAVLADDQEEGYWLCCTKTDVYLENDMFSINWLEKVLKLHLN